MLIIFNRGFNACIYKEARDNFIIFKLVMYTLFLLIVILALLSNIHPLLIYVSQGIALFFLIIALILNLCSLYLPEQKGD